MIVAEDSLAEVGEGLWQCAKKLTRFSIFTKFSSDYNNNCQLLTPLHNSFALLDVVVVLTTQRVNEALFENARQNGTRILLLNNTSKKLIERLFKANYKKLNQISRKLADIFSIGKTLHLQSPSGTDAKISINRLHGYAEGGMANKAGEFSTLPAGDASLFLNKNTDGIIKLDRIAGQSNSLSEPISLKVQKGHVTQIKGGPEAELLRKELRKLGASGREIKEFGVGTNNTLKLGYSAQEDEKVAGTAHISLGQNQSTKVHGKIIPAIKGIILKPTIRIDNKTIIDQGESLLY
ncbi:MAG: hypothetical protein ACE5HS_04670 [bacterium]